MSSYVSKESIELMMPNRLGHYFKDDLQYTTVPEVPNPVVFGMIWSFVTWLAEMPRRRAVVEELNSLSEHELADIGLSRSEVTRVFDPGFAAERRSERANLAHVRPVGV